MLSKIAKKLAQKSSIFSTKANFERNLIFFLFIFSFIFLESIEKPAKYPASALGWSIPNYPYSPPPRLMGKQMGTVNTLGVPPLGYGIDGNVKVFHLIAQPVYQQLTDGKGDALTVNPYSKITFPTSMPPIPPAKTLKLWGYNGTSPGPTIEIFEGDRVRIILKNELPEPTSIHWHGLEVPNQEDGAGDTTQKAVLPGETYTYEFTVHQTGTYMYHTGFNVLKQDAMGLSGMFVIHPKHPRKKIDKDFAILLQEYSIEEEGNEPKVLSMDNNWFTMNGHVYPSIPVLEVNRGDRVRIRFGNLSLQAHPIHLHGYSFKIVGTEGGPIPDEAQWPAATIYIAPGQTRDIEFIAWNPGLWRLHCHVLHHILNNDDAYKNKPLGIFPIGGMFTYLKVN